MMKHTTINITTTEVEDKYCRDPSVETINNTLSFHDDASHRNVEMDETMKEIVKLIADAVGEEAVLKFIIEMYEDVALNRLGYYEKEKVLKINEGLQLKPEFYISIDNCGKYEIGSLEEICQWQLEKLVTEEGRLLQVVNHTKLFNEIGGDILKNYRKVVRRVKAEARKKAEAKKAREAKKKQREIEKAKKLLEKEGVK